MSSMLVIVVAMLMAVPLCPDGVRSLRTENMPVWPGVGVAVNVLPVSMQHSCVGATHLDPT
jgi:hypothetical protein